MASGPIRRGQLIAPFGVGAMLVNRDGISLIATGLDHWYELETSEGANVTDIEEFKKQEWRLEKLLGVNHLRLPPDYRRPRYGQKVPNTNITVPFLRFPTWYFCPNKNCNRLYKFPLTERGKIKCPECNKRGNRYFLYQVPLVAICDCGHMQDFSWSEWVHRNIHPNCNKQLYLISTGIGTLAGLKVKCDCGDERPLSPIMGANLEKDTTDLSDNLEDGDGRYLCTGIRPWLGTEEASSCGRPMRAALRSASNVYFAQVKNSIYLPRSSEIAPTELVALLENPPISTFINILIGLDGERKEKINATEIRRMYPHIVNAFEDKQIESALQIVLETEGKDSGESSHTVASDDQETAFRRSEYSILRQTYNESDLRISDPGFDNYGSNIPGWFSKVLLVEKLRETRVLTGFTRIYPESNLTQDELKALFWREMPDKHNSWLPAYEVFGEGIFLEFNNDRITTWEHHIDVEKRIKPLNSQYKQLYERRRLRNRMITPRFVLIHTFAHLLINQLIFECGYSSAALRERLYVSADPEEPMGGVLLYTAAGDSEGTMGGLVRMGKPGFLEAVIQRALDKATWCSADPVCMEVAKMGGQGPDSCNLAACHNCALVPETTCEEFNRFLDRGIVVGDRYIKGLGYFELDSNGG